MLRAQNEPVKCPPSQHKRPLELNFPRLVSVPLVQLSEGDFPIPGDTLGPPVRAHVSMEARTNTKATPPLGNGCMDLQL